ncbi:MAG: heat-inducible transcription repressor HrcA [Nitrospirae bacterium]|nr:heat-inducible transcription repressor HrcA [Nitrospirota bacterium]MBF0534735.1 heat-inducible transcription repressor HrcA [Nitrospirota bacterium]MBF0616409.1 heat-inducible transcription repressor HrcA [Nitrospirota bacterium]
MEERLKKILFAVIESYVDSASPVGSRYISKRFGLGISSATIRNAMCDLEEMGYLSQPHTSAGRMPTGKGYRLLVEELMGFGVSANAELLKLLCDEVIGVRGHLSGFLGAASKILSTYSHYMVVAMETTMENSILGRIELLRCRNDMVAVVLMTEEGTIKHKVSELDVPLSRRDLKNIADFLNSEFRGRTLGEIKIILEKEVRDKRVQRDTLISKVFGFFDKYLSSFDRDVFISGLGELINLPDFDDIGKIKELSNAISDKERIIEILDKITENGGVQVFVGSEPFLDKKELSLVASSVCDRGRPLGVLGLIGPQRMNYASAISIIETSARFLSSRLEDRQEVDFGGEDY